MSDLTRFAEDLRENADTLTRRASQVVRKAALDTMADAKTLAPVDTGNLRNSITTDARQGDLVAVVEATADYAAAVEFGIDQRPQPYMRPAQDRNTEPFMDAIAQLAEGV
mgnify:CR=1 FL=1